MSAYTDNSPLMPSSRSYVKVGLGGAGNHIPRHNIISRASIPSLLRTTRIESIGAFYTGIGGAGDHTSSQDVRIEENPERIKLRQGSVATNWHHGKEGTRNRASSDESSSASSSLLSSTSSKSTGTMNEKLSGVDRIKEKIAQKWEARNQRVSLFQAWQRKLPTLQRELAIDARSADSYDGFVVKC
jgi:hypothetical protein